MASVAAARTALATAVSASEKETSGTACYVMSGGTDWSGLGGSSVRWDFRVVCAVGFGGDVGTAETALAALVAAKLTILQASSLYQINGVSPSGSRSINGGDHLTADIAVSTKVDI